MNTDQHSFIAAMRDKPDDDAIRLIFADWLEENGQGERAEFIRVQCELSSRPCHAFMYSCYENFYQCHCDSALQSRQKKLLEKIKRNLINVDHYSSEIHGTTVKYFQNYGINEIYATFIRGFAVEVRCKLYDFLQHGPAIAAEHPVEHWLVSDVEYFEFEEHWTIFFDRETIWDNPLLKDKAHDLIGQEFVSLGGEYIEWHKSETDAKRWFANRCRIWANRQAAQSVIV